jgi:sialic acid synthase SpsE
MKIFAFPLYAAVSTSLGTDLEIIQQHIDAGVDSSFSMEPDEMRTLVVETERAWQSLGKVKYGPTEKETAFLVFRRLIYVVEDMRKGDVFTKENLKIIRPGYGLQPQSS